MPLEKEFQIDDAFKPNWKVRAKKIPRSHIALKKTTQSLAIHKTIDPHWNHREAARAHRSVTTLGKPSDTRALKAGAGRNLLGEPDQTFATAPHEQPEQSHRRLRTA